jgi:hypothetical protein
VNEERREREEQASERSERSACLKRTPETRPTDLTENITPHERKRHTASIKREPCVRSGLEADAQSALRGDTEFACATGGGLVDGHCRTVAR